MYGALLCTRVYVSTERAGLQYVYSSNRSSSSACEVASERSVIMNEVRPRVIKTLHIGFCCQPSGKQPIPPLSVV